MIRSKIIIKRLLFIGLMLILISCSNSKMNKIVKEFKTVPELKHSNFGISVLNTETNKILWSENADKILVPASNQKLYTTAAMLEMFGSDYTFKTKISYSGTIDKNGVLNGDLYIIGGGDPSLGSKYLISNREELEDEELLEKQLSFFNIWVKKIQELGIKKINGKIIGDSSYFPEFSVLKTWEWVDMSYDYGASPSGLTILDNSFKLNLTIGENNIVSSSVKPDGIAVKIKNNLKENLEGPNNIILVVPPYSNTINVLGTINKNKIYNTVIQDPTFSTINLFKNKLETVGINCLGLKTVSNKSKRDKLTEVLVHESPKLSSLISLTNKMSINLFAEHFKIAINKKLLESKENELNKKLFQEYLKKTFKISALYNYDGSGMSRYNGFSPNETITLLSYMKNSPNFKIYYDSLAEPGKIGTMKKFSKNTVLVDNLHAKSGTLTGVKAYSGYMYNQNNKLLAFSIMVNNHGLKSSEISKEIQKIMEAIYYLN